MSSPYRRRRIIWSLILFTGAFVFYVSRNASPNFWALPASWKDLGLNADRSSSPAAQVAIAKQKAQVSELDALLHFVTAHPDRTLNEADGGIEVAGIGRLEVDKDSVDVRAFAPNGNFEWEKHAETLREQAPLVVFSKSYCPYSRKAKTLLGSLNISPSPAIVELDLRSDGSLIQDLLLKTTGRRTVPNVILHGKSLGGSDDIQRLYDEEELVSILEDKGLKVNSPH